MTKRCSRNFLKKNNWQPLTEFDVFLISSAGSRRLSDPDGEVRSVLEYANLSGSAYMRTRPWRASAGDAALSAALVVAPEVAAPRRGGWPGRPEGVSTVAFVQIQNVIEPAYEAWECYMLASDASQSENKVTDWISSLQLGQVSHYTCLKISPQEIAC